MRFIGGGESIFSVVAFLSCDNATVLTMVSKACLRIKS